MKTQELVSSLRSMLAAVRGRVGDLATRHICRDSGARKPLTNLRVSPHTRAVAAEDHLVVLDIASGRVYKSNGAASLVWRGLAARRSLESISDELTSRCDISFVQAVELVAAFARRLSRMGLVLNSVR